MYSINSALSGSVSIICSNVSPRMMSLKLSIFLHVKSSSNFKRKHSKEFFITMCKERQPVGVGNVIKYTPATLTNSSSNEHIHYNGIPSYLWVVLVLVWRVTKTKWKVYLHPWISIKYHHSIWDKTTSQHMVYDRLYCKCHSIVWVVIWTLSYMLGFVQLQLHRT